MFASRPLSGAMVVVLLLAGFVPAAAGTAGAANQAYAGTHVSFGTSANAVTDYAVGGETMLSTVKVQSASEAEGGGVVDVGASLSTVTSLEGAGLSLGAQTQTRAKIDVEGSASMDAHDNANGILVVRAGGEPQYVQANLSSGAEATAKSDDRVTVTTADGGEGTFIVVGDGEVAVNEEGDVAAKLGQDGQLVFRAYQDGKSDDDAEQERLIAAGQAAGEVHVMRRNGETVTDTVTYGSQTTVQAKQSAEGQVEVTVDRAQHQGKVVITSVSDSALNTADGVSVAVDGETAVEASSYSELKGAFGSDQSKYLVRQSASGEASADVLVAVNHFSERTITMRESDGSATTDDGAGDGGSTGGTDPSSDGSGADSDGESGISTPGQPGFGVLVTVAALLGAALMMIRRG